MNLIKITISRISMKQVDYEARKLPWRLINLLDHVQILSLLYWSMFRRQLQIEETCKTSKLTIKTEASTNYEVAIIYLWRKKIARSKQEKLKYTLLSKKPHEIIIGSISDSKLLKNIHINLKKFGPEDKESKLIPNFSSPQTLKENGYLKKNYWELEILETTSRRCCMNFILDTFWCLNAGSL